MAIPQKQIYTEADYYVLPEDILAELIDGQIYYQAAQAFTPLLSPVLEAL